MIANHLRSHRQLYVAAVVLGLNFSSRLQAGNFGRELKIGFGTYPTGKLNSITDVKGVQVGQVTLNSGVTKSVKSQGAARTGVTVIMPGNGDPWLSKPMAGSYVLNGNGEAMGLLWLNESGQLESPIALTNTLSVANVQRGMLEWTLKRHPEVDAMMPVVLECDDSFLNDIHAQYVLPKHSIEALENLSDRVEEGSVGAGTGMVSFDFKSGIGTASRIVEVADSNKKLSFTLGVLINTNIGTETRGIFQIAGISIAKEIPDFMPKENKPPKKGSGSAVIVVATDAPLDSRQLARLAKRATLGLARLGTVGYNGSGEIAIAFSTSNRIPENAPAILTYKTLSNPGMNNFFEAVTEATEEAA